MGKIKKEKTNKTMNQTNPANQYSFTNGAHILCGWCTTHNTVHTIRPTNDSGWHPNQKYIIKTQVSTENKGQTISMVNNCTNKYPFSVILPSLFGNHYKYIQISTLFSCHHLWSLSQTGQVGMRPIRSYVQTLQGGQKHREKHNEQWEKRERQREEGIYRITRLTLHDHNVFL